MALRSMFKAHKNKTYNYAPRFYNARKERLDNLLKEKEVKSDAEYVKGYRRSSYRDGWKTQKSKGLNVNRRLRFIVILIFLLIFAYAAIKYGKLDFLH